MRGQSGSRSSLWTRGGSGGPSLHPAVPGFFGTTTTSDSLLGVVPAISGSPLIRFPTGRRSPGDRSILKLPDGIAIAFFAGVYAAVRRYGLYDSGLTLFNYIGYSLPTFALAGWRTELPDAGEGACATSASPLPFLLSH